MKLLSIGEVLWDLIDGEAYIGGAPFNLAAHAARLGMETWLVSAVGKDDLGERARTKVRELGMRDDYLHTNDQPTGVVDVCVDDAGKPTFNIRKPAAWDFIEISSEEIAALRAEDFDAICYGTLAQRHEVTEATLRAMLASLRGEGRPKLFCDINLRPPFFDAEKVKWSIAAADILKLNDDEVEVCSELFKRPFEGIEPFCAWASRAHGLELILVTLGADGCLIYAGGEAKRIEGVKVKVSDTVGSGDAFAASFLLRYLAGDSPEDAARTANRVGAFVASKPGAVPDYTPDDLPSV